MKILVAHVPAGSGHERAAQAVLAGVTHFNHTIDTVLLDAIQGADPYYQWAFTQGYTGLIDRAPFLWGLMYYLTDCPILTRLSQKLHRLENARHGKGLEKLLLSAQPDVIIATHFFPIEVAAFLKRTGRLSSRVIAVITDYLPHALWIAPGVDQYVVGFPETKEELIKRGVEQKQISVLGIPIDPKFSKQNDRVNLAKRLGLMAGCFTVLIASGGLGTGPIVSLVKTLSRVKEKMQLLVVTGKKASLFKPLSALSPRIPHSMKVYGFVYNMDELMDLADLMLTKPGGLSCMEALAKGLPLLLVSPIPGQESRNGWLLSKMGVAMAAQRLQSVPILIEKLRREPQRLQALAEKGKAAARPHAALEIAALAVQGISQR